MSSLLEENQGWTIAAIQYLDTYGLEFENAMDVKIEENNKK